jgi:hypothetical protein
MVRVIYVIDPESILRCVNPIAGARAIWFWRAVIFGLATPSTALGADVPLLWSDDSRPSMFLIKSISSCRVRRFERELGLICIARSARFSWLLGILVFSKGHLSALKVEGSVTLVLSRLTDSKLGSYSSSTSIKKTVARFCKDDRGFACWW